MRRLAGEQSQTSDSTCCWHAKCSVFVYCTTLSWRLKIPCFDKDYKVLRVMAPFGTHFNWLPACNFLLFSLFFIIFLHLFYYHSSSSLIEMKTSDSWLDLTLEWVKFWRREVHSSFHLYFPFNSSRSCWEPSFFCLIILKKFHLAISFLNFFSNILLIPLTYDLSFQQEKKSSSLYINHRQ